MKVSFKRKEEGKKLKGKSGSKLARRMWKEQLKEEHKKRRRAIMQAQNKNK